jgi:protein-tyrosine phosphatase
MVDIHSHILYGVDDGSKDLQMSLDMLKIAADSGTTDIVATPHSDLQYRFQPEEIERQIAELSAAAPAIRIHVGCDFHLHFDNIRDCLDHPEKYTINHKRYLMVEFSDTLIAKSTGDVFDRMQRAGITPVITHPERNPLLMKQVNNLTQWVQAGCLIQVTSQSFLGRFGKSPQNAAEALMSRNLVHFVASDAHDPEYRPPTLRPGFERVSETYGPEVARRLFIANPAAALTGDYIDVEYPDAASKPRKWYRLW